MVKKRLRSIIKATEGVLLPLDEFTGSDLPELTLREEEFVTLLMFDASVNGIATEAWTRVYDPERKFTKGYKWRASSTLRNSARVKEWIGAIRAANLDRMVCTLEEHMSELSALREEARSAGHYAAAINAELRRGQAAGHYIDRKEIVIRQGDDLSKLVELVKTGQKQIALSYAKDLGLTADLERALAKDKTVH